MSASRDRGREDGSSHRQPDGHRTKHRSRSPRERHPDRDAGAPHRQHERDKRSPRQRPDLSPSRSHSPQRRGGDQRGWGRPEGRGRREEERGEGRRDWRRGDRRGGRGEERGEGGREESYGRRRQDGDRNRQRRRRSQEPDPSQFEFGGRAAAPQEGNRDEDEDDQAAKAEPNYALSGKLAAETNTYKGVVLNYSEPEEARIPKTRWRLYGFKGEETLPTFYIHRQSAYLIGRDRRVCDVPMDHPSCSKQHAVLQYRLVEYTKPNGATGKRVKPYLIDLSSTNGSYINNERIESARYYELKEKDMIKFGFSSREFVILHENSKTEESEDEQD